MATKISVLVPSFGRPETLRRCLSALVAQARPADEVVVVTRTEDAATRALLSGFDMAAALPLHEVVVDRPGQIRALVVGSQVASGGIVAITDDDAEPRPDWLLRLERLFDADPTVTGVGGRDVVEGVGEARREREVGRVRWYGKVVGNHHLGAGGVREVDILKGANMSFRGDRLRAQGFDERLRGEGAQVHNDLKLSLALRRNKGKLVYDSELVVDHRPAARPAGDHRLRPSARQLIDATHNETLALLEFLPGPRRWAFLVWAPTVGTRGAPGLGHLLLALPRERREALRRFAATMRGRGAGWRSFRAASGTRAQS